MVGSSLTSERAEEWRQLGVWFRSDIKSRILGLLRAEDPSIGEADIFPSVDHKPCNKFQSCLVAQLQLQLQLQVQLRLQTEHAHDDEATHTVRELQPIFEQTDRKSSVEGTCVSLR